jgi:hypothetical protein
MITYIWPQEGKLNYMKICTNAMYDRIFTWSSQICILARTIIVGVGPQKRTNGLGDVIKYTVVIAFRTLHVGRTCFGEPAPERWQVTRMRRLTLPEHETWVEGEESQA